RPPGDGRAAAPLQLLQVLLEVPLDDGLVRVGGRDLRLVAAVRALQGAGAGVELDLGAALLTWEELPGGRSLPGGWDRRWGVGHGASRSEDRGQRTESSSRKVAMTQRRREDTDGMEQNQQFGSVRSSCPVWVSLRLCGFA